MGIITKCGKKKPSRPVKCIPNVVIKSFMMKLVYTIKTTVSAISLWCSALQCTMLINLIRGSGEPISFDRTCLKQRRLAEGEGGQQTSGASACFGMLGKKNGF